MGHCIHPGGVGSTCGPLMVVETLCPIYLISKRHDDQGPRYALIIHPQQRHTSLTDKLEQISSQLLVDFEKNGKSLCLGLFKVCVQSYLQIICFPIQSLELPDSIIDGQKATSNTICVSLSDSADRPPCGRIITNMNDALTMWIHTTYMWMDKVDPHIIE